MATIAAYGFTVPVTPIPDDSALLHGGSIPSGNGGAFTTAGRGGRGFRCTTTGFQITPYSGADLLYAPKTIAAWVTPDSQASRVRVIATLPSLFTLYFSNASGFPAFTFGGTTITGPTSLLDGLAHHVLGSYDGVYGSTGTLTLWIDGVQVASATAGASSPSSGIVSVGWSPSITNSSLDGIVNDVRFLNDPTPHPLTSETAAYWRDTPVRNQLELAYNFSEPSGTAVLDAGPYGRNSALTAYGERVTGHTGSGVHPTSTTQASVIGTVMIPSTSRFSIQGWVHLDSVAAGYDRLLSIVGADGTTPKLIITRAGTNLQLSVWDIANVKTTQTASLGSTNLSSGWHHIAVSVAVNKLTIYTDGAIILNGDGPVSTWADFSILKLGYYLSGESNGGVTWDDLRITSNYLGEDATVVTAYMNLPVESARKTAYFGTTTIAKAYFGATAVPRAYAGATLVLGA